MITTLIFKGIAFDTNRIGPIISAGTSYQFFIDYPIVEEERVTQQKEDQIVLWLFSQTLARQFIFTELGMRNPCFWLNVVDPIIDNPNKKPGDIDILICEQRQPHRAIALECKRVKVIAMDMENDKINKIDNIGNGVKQANALREIGFHRTYLAILIEVEGKNRAEYNTLCRGPSPTTFKKVYDFPFRDKLNKDVGVIFIEISQPTGKSIDSMAGVGICIDKEAERLEQPYNLTNRINTLLGG
jgi:hypothetical protein